MRLFAALTIGLFLGSIPMALGLVAPRNRAVAQRFERTHPMPDKCLNPDGTPRMRQIRDCIVNHKKALECGGTDTVDNMEWQTYSESLKSDREEAKCK